MQKLEVVGSAKAHTDAEAARHFCIPRTLHAWKRLKLQPKYRKKSHRAVPMKCKREAQKEGKKSQVVTCSAAEQMLKHMVINSTFPTISNKEE